MTGPAASSTYSRPEQRPTRCEEADLLRGRGRFADDLPEPRGVLHTAILRSPHGHAELVSIDASAALAMPGVACVVTGEDARRWTKPFAVAVKTPMQHWCLAVQGKLSLPFGGRSDRDVEPTLVGDGGAVAGAEQHGCRRGFDDCRPRDHL